MKNYAIKTVVLLCIIFMLSSCDKKELLNTSNSNIISYCVGDIDSDGADELIAINNAGESDKLPTGEPCGKLVEIYRDFNILDGKLTLGEKPDYSFDFSDMNPSKVQLGDVNGDGKTDISIIMYKKVKFHNALAKRPFFYDFESEKLVPLWLGSRLSRPFDDFILSDVDEDKTSELVSIEELENKNRVLALYKWEGFGFRLVAQSSEEFNKIKFDDDNDDGIKIVADKKEREVKFIGKDILVE